MNQAHSGNEMKLQTENLENHKQKCNYLGTQLIDITCDFFKFCDS